MMPRNKDETIRLNLYDQTAKLMRSPKPLPVLVTPFTG
jgi:hypothetical protein